MENNVSFRPGTVRSCCCCCCCHSYVTDFFHQLLCLYRHVRSRTSTHDTTRTYRIWIMTLTLEGVARNVLAALIRHYSPYRPLCNIDCTYSTIHSTLDYTLVGALVPWSRPQAIHVAGTTTCLSFASGCSSLPNVFCSLFTAVGVPMYPVPKPSTDCCGPVG